MSKTNIGVDYTVVKDIRVFGPKIIFEIRGYIFDALTVAVSGRYYDICLFLDGEATRPPRDLCALGAVPATASTVSS